MTDVHVRLSEEDYLATNPPGDPACYRPEVAETTMLSADEALPEVLRRAEARNLPLDPDTLIGLLRELMRERYDAELSRSAS